MTTLPAAPGHQEQADGVKSEIGALPAEPSTDVQDLKQSAQAPAKWSQDAASTG